MVNLNMKKKLDESQLEMGQVCLGFKNMRLLFNVGTFPGGGNCIIVEADGEIQAVNSNDLIHDLDAYDLSWVPAK